MSLKAIIKNDKSHLRQVYQRIILLALLVHSLYAILFWFFDIHVLTYYHSLSVIFYFLMLYFVNINKFRITVSAIHIEVSIFVIISTLYCGWDAGFTLYLIALATLVYFCPFDHKYIPYLFSLSELLIFFALKFFLVPQLFVTSSLHIQELNFLYFMNAISSFIIILYAALISNLSAETTKQVLLEDNHTLKEIADHDQLTTLLSRHYLLDKIDQVDISSQNIVVIIADIDNFKSINDHYGHPCGDYILQTLALLIKSHLSEETDICRWGGEEFVIAAYHQNKEDVLIQMKELCNIIHNYHFIYKKEPIHISMTFGMAYYDEKPTFNKLVELADKRLYQGKTNGKNIVIDYDQEA